MCLLLVKLPVWKQPESRFHLLQLCVVIPSLCVVPLTVCGWHVTKYQISCPICKCNGCSESTKQTHEMITKFFGWWFVMLGLLPFVSLSLFSFISSVNFVSSPFASFLFSPCLLSVSCLLLPIFLPSFLLFSLSCFLLPLSQDIWLCHGYQPVLEFCHCSLSHAGNHLCR